MHQSLGRQKVHFVFAYESHYAGSPSPELDTAWQELLSKSNIRVTEEELRRNNQSSVILPGGGGYLAWLEAHHQLHCVVSSANAAPWILADACSAEDAKTVDISSSLSS